MSGHTADGTSQSTRDRIKRRIRTSSADEIARKVATRLKAHRYVADSLSKTAADLVLTGSSAADRIDRNLTSESRKVEGYVREGELEAFAKRHLLTLNNDGDVTIYEGPASELLDGHVAAHAVIAADLARSTTARERSAGLAALVVLD